MDKNLLHVQIVSCQNRFLLAAPGYNWFKPGSKQFITFQKDIRVLNEQLFLHWMWYYFAPTFDPKLFSNGDSYYCNEVIISYNDFCTYK